MKKFLLGVGIITVIVIISAFASRYFGASRLTVYEEMNRSDLLQGGGNPEGWPEDAPPPYMQAPVLYSHENDGLNRGATSRGLGAVYNVSAPREEVVGYYVEELEAFGWTVSVPNLPGDTIVITAEKDLRRFDVYLIAADGLTAVTTGILFNESSSEE